MLVHDEQLVDAAVTITPSVALGLNVDLHNSQASGTAEAAE